MMAADGVPGCAVAIVRGGREVSCHCHGVASVELSAPVTRETVFKLGSISKHFIAAAALALVRRGRLSLSDSVRDHLPEAPESWAGMSVGHLATHTSGLPRDPANFAPFEDRQYEWYVASAFALPLLAQAGATWAYSNLGYFVLASVISRASGMPFRAAIRHLVFDEAGLAQTSIAHAWDIVGHRASSYLRAGDALLNAGDVRSLRPSGAVLSSVSDMAQWMRVLLTGGSTTLEELSSVAQLDSGAPVRYGLGLFVDTLNGRRVVHHGGALWCFRCQLVLMPDEQTGIVVLANAREASARRLACVLGDHLHPDLDLVRVIGSRPDPTSG